MEVQFLTAGRAADVVCKLIRDCDRCSFAVAWATENRVAHAFKEHEEKIRHGIIGTHMYQTSPAALRQFLGSKRARYIPPTGATFHPKVYIFWLGRKLTAVVGSHNMTAGAFESGNIEASFVYTGDATESAFRDLLGFVEHTWKNARAIAHDEFFQSYEIQYEATKRSRQALGRFHLFPRTGKGRKSSLMTLTWAEFREGVRRDKWGGEEARVTLLERARELFQTKRSFARMERDERRAIAGTFGRKEPQYDHLDWAMYGTMFPQGNFKNLVNEDFHHLSAALDQIPVLGEVTERDYNRFVARFQKAFEDKNRKGGVATASRLLAMKRSDWFVAINNGNRKDLCRSVGAAPTTLTLDNYWSDIVVPITMSAWWNHSRPHTRRDARIWDHRAALLDCHYYEPA